MLGKLQIAEELQSVLYGKVCEFADILISYSYSKVLVAESPALADRTAYLAHILLYLIL